MEGPKSFSIEALLSTNDNKGKLNSPEAIERTYENSVSGPNPEAVHRVLEMTSAEHWQSDSPVSSPASIDSLARDEEDSAAEAAALLDPGSSRRKQRPASRGSSGTGRVFDDGLGSRMGPGGHAVLVHRQPGLVQHGPGGLFYRYGVLHPPTGGPQAPQTQTSGLPSHPGAVALSMLASGSAFHSPGPAGPAGMTSGAGGQGLHPGAEPAMRMAAHAQVQAAAAAAHMQNIQLDWLARAGIFIPRMVDYSGRWKGTFQMAE